MTKFTVVAVLLLVNAAFGANVFLGNKNKMTVGVFAQLQAIEDTSFGKNLLDTIALQVKNKAPLKEISTLLADLKEDLEKQQARDDELHIKREQECADAIANYNARIEFASNEIDESTKRIADLNNKIGQLKESIAEHKKQIQDTEDEIASAKETRAKNAKQFESRKAQHQSVLDALELILEKLEAYGTQALEDETALLQLAKIGKKNPIAAFVQVAATLSPESWDNVKQKLTALKEATAASLADDDAQETAEIERHNKLIETLETLLSDTKAKLAKDEQDLREQEADLAQQQIRLETNTKELAIASEEKATKEQQCESWRTQYFKEKEQRSSEIAIVEKVQDIFAKKLETAEDYLKQRMEADRQ